MTDSVGRHNVDDLVVSDVADLSWLALERPKEDSSDLVLTFELHCDLVLGGCSHSVLNECILTWKFSINLHKVNDTHY